VSHPSVREALAYRIELIEQRIAQACMRSGRKRAEVQLVAVTKSIPDDWLPLLPELGFTHLGESRPQELWRKSALLGSEQRVNWHLIGHLQRNKIDRTLPLIHTLHSVDSIRLLQALDEAMGRLGVAPPVLLEVNTSGEPSKQGFTPDAVVPLAPVLQGLQFLRIRGLMTMAAHDDNPENCRPSFRTLSSLLAQIRPLLPETPSPLQLSMGMSNDFEVAIEEGATLIRVGSALFGDIPG
jgi:pyridoxal phosphate enzyme (YggS family)